MVVVVVTCSGSGGGEEVVVVMSSGSESGGEENGVSLGVVVRSMNRLLRSLKGGLEREQQLGIV
ncbi:hypothetical protein QJS10_CPB13g01436 [Acorus calamus]|uniref:Uncharacterized protein n=1 Tax=Acorus calamus TaxID=4465 RepID=A0AAV9DJ36_ACOCL|nr:hypothetical protein QJS10_CPB13g01436 [Acorus calamus]